MQSKLLRLGAVLALVILTAVSVAWSKSGNDQATGPTPPAQPAIDTDMSSIQALGLTGSGGGDDQFGASVIGVDVGSGLLLLANGITLVVNQSTVWDPPGDLSTLESTAGAVSMGQPVRAEGSGALQADGTVLALTIKVEIDD